MSRPLLTLLALVLSISTAAADSSVMRLQLPSPILFSGDTEGEEEVPPAEENTSPPTVSMSSISTKLGRPVDVTPQAVNLTSPAQWSVAAGELPLWLTLDPTSGRLTGTAQAETSVGGIELKARGANGREAQTAPFSIAAENAFIVAAPNETWRMGGVSSTHAVQDGAVLPSWSIASGPAWLSVAPNGLISGSPAGAGTVSYSLRAQDQDGSAALGTGTIEVKEALAFTTHPSSLSTIPGQSSTTTVAMSGTPVGQQLRIAGPVGETATYPAWLSIGSSGTIIAAPPAGTAAGSFGPFRIAGRDAAKGPDALSDTFSVSVPGDFKVASIEGVRSTYTGSGQTWALSSTSSYPKPEMMPCIRTGCTIPNVVTLFWRSDIRDVAKVHLDGVQTIRNLTIGLTLSISPYSAKVTLLNSTNGASKELTFNTTSHTFTGVDFAADEIQVTLNVPHGSTMTTHLRLVEATLF